MFLKRLALKLGRKIDSVVWRLSSKDQERSTLFLRTSSMGEIGRGQRKKLEADSGRDAMIVHN